MMGTSVHEDTNLYLLVDDDRRHIHEFDINSDFPDSDEYAEANVVRVSIRNCSGIIAYMEILLLYEDRIDGDIVMFADGISQDAHNAMYALNKNGFFEPSDLDAESLDDIFASGVIANLNYIAVHDEHRNNGYGKWLIRNLPKILDRNYGIHPRVIITSICPQIISWGESNPSFRPPEDEAPKYEPMHDALLKLFAKNGYQQLGSTNHYITKPFSIKHSDDF